MVQAHNSGERLSRFLAHAGRASRRHAEELIAQGRVQVNGITITEQGTRLHPDADTVVVDGKPVHAPSKQVYLLLHKPDGYISSAHDPQGRPTVLDLLPAALRTLRVYPVGRLDVETSGLLLLTNDGDFALHLTHPRSSMQKHYRALVRGCPSESSLEMLRSGVVITEDKERSHTTARAKVSSVRRVGRNCWLSLSIHEGRKRQVRRMLAVVGHAVLELSRVGVGPLQLGEIPMGKWRYLTPEEVNMLRGSTQASQTV